MMRTVFLALVVGIASLAAAGEITMSVRSTDGVTGSAKLVNKVLDDGSKYVQLTMQLKTPQGGAVTVVQESTYDRTGRPVRKLQQTTMPGDAAKQAIVVTFDSAGANVKVTQGGKTVSETIGAPAGKSILAKSEFWFVKDTPAPGGTTTYHRFDIQANKWVETKVFYRGRRDIKVNGKTVLAHLMEYDNVKAYLDDKGDPLLIKMGSTTLERTS